jgi:hypothetical protein
MRCMGVFRSLLDDCAYGHCLVSDPVSVFESIVALFIGTQL